jgi:hypothetical protein
MSILRDCMSFMNFPGRPLASGVSIGVKFPKWLLASAAYFVVGFLLMPLVSRPANAQEEAHLPNAPSQYASAKNDDIVVAQQTEPSGINVRDLAIDSHRPPRTLDRQFVLLNSLLVAATLADAELTLHCVNSLSCRELNPILGSHPTRGRMYAIAVPLTAVSVYLSYHYKRKSPSKGWWKVYPITFSAVHSVGPIYYLLASHTH